MKNPNPYVISAGMFRSGSTVLFNILRLLGILMDSNFYSGYGISDEILTMQQKEEKFSHMILSKVHLRKEIKKIPDLFFLTYVELFFFFYAYNYICVRKCRGKQRIFFFVKMKYLKVLAQDHIRIIRTIWL